MSISIRLDGSDCDKLDKDLTIEIIPKYGPPVPRYVVALGASGGNLFVPFSYARRTLGASRPPRSAFPVMRTAFVGRLRPTQIVLKREAIHRLNQAGSVMISAYPGFGKTCLAIHLAACIRLRTLILVNKIVLIKQWSESLARFCPSAKVRKLAAQSEPGPADFYVMNAQNVHKKGRSFFRDIGLVIVDEAHQLVAEQLALALQFVCPRYMIALTATPFRYDALDRMLALYFGRPALVRKLNRKHTVFKIETGFSPRVEYTPQKRVNWASIVDQLASSPSRNILIVRIVGAYKKRRFLILVKRVAQGRQLLEMIKSQGETVTDLLGSKQDFDPDARVLIGTTQKVGVGFDHPSLDALILAADVKAYFVQYLGRVFRRPSGTPIIFDLVDKNGILRRHFREREKVYREHGGRVVNMSPVDIINNDDVMGGE